MFGFTRADGVTQHFALALEMIDAFLKLSLLRGELSAVFTADLRELLFMVRFELGLLCLAVVLTITEPRGAAPVLGLEGFELFPQLLSVGLQLLVARAEVFRVFRVRPLQFSAQSTGFSAESFYCAFELTFFLAEEFVLHVELRELLVGVAELAAVAQHAFFELEMSVAD